MLGLQYAQGIIATRGVGDVESGRRYRVDCGSSRVCIFLYDEYRWRRQSRLGHQVHLYWSGHRSEARMLRRNNI
ncbi:MAG: hypothetical protein AAAB20_17540 [Rhizobium sp.]|jgi:hypothetical protein|uniref:hypothetical protein n=1 Tax=Rhizobium sp. TaxID=391 RepID=UPI000AB9FC93